MFHIQSFNNLYEELRHNIIDRVQEIGKDSDVGFPTIEIEEDEFQYNLDNDRYLTEIGEDYLFDSYGHSYDFCALDIENLCHLVDYLNTIK